MLFIGVFMVYPLIDVLIYSFEEGYNSASQTYFGYNTENLANASLTEAQKTVNPTGTYEQAFGTPFEGATAKILGISLLLEDDIAMKIIVDADAAAKVQIAQDENFEIVWGEYELTQREDGETYKVIFPDLTPICWNTLFYIRVVDENGETISRTVAYSVAAYCENMHSAISSDLF